jgi:polysaccharide export outer membrane protein
MEIPVDLRKIFRGDASDVPMRPDDILFVPNSAAKSASMRAIEASIQVATGVVIWRR